MDYKAILLSFFFEIPNIAVITSFIFFYSKSAKIENLTLVNLILFFNLISLFLINNSIYKFDMPDQIKYSNSIASFRRNVFQFDFYEKLSFDVALFAKILAFFPLGYQASGFFFLPIVNKLLENIIFVHMLKKKIINFNIFILLLLTPSLFFNTSFALREMLIIFIIYFMLYNLVSKKYLKFFVFAILLFLLKKPFFLIIFILLIIRFVFFLRLEQSSKFFNSKKELITFKIMALFFISASSLILIDYNYDFLRNIVVDAQFKNISINQPLNIILKSKLSDYPVLIFESVRNIAYIPGVQNFKTMIYFFDFIFLSYLIYVVCNYCNLIFFKRVFYFIIFFFLTFFVYQLIINHGTFFRWRLLLFTSIIFIILIFERKKNLYNANKII
jgi:hypothetical protein